MFDWNQEDGVTDAIWGDYKEREDLILPFPKAGEDHTSMIEDYWNKQINEQKHAGVRSEQSAFGSENEHHGCNLDGSNSRANEELLDSRFHVDTLSTLPSVDNGFAIRGNDGIDYGSASSTMVNDCIDTPNFCDSRDSTFTQLWQSGDILDDNDPSSFKESHGFSFDDRMEADSKTNVFSSEHGQKEVDSFLDCDWGSIMDFDDFDQFDGIFRNSYSMFGHETTRDMDELLLPKDSTNTSTPFSVPDISINKSVEKQSCTSQEENKSQGKRKSIEDDKMGEQKRFLKSHRKLEEKRTTKPQELNCFSQGQAGQSEHASYFASSHQALAGYEHPTLPLPSKFLMPQVQFASKLPQPVVAFNVYPHHHPKHTDSVQNTPDVTTRTSMMTPQEKVEKLRRRQQMQALLAIKQQEKQFGKQVDTTDIAVSQTQPHMNHSPGSNLSDVKKTKDNAKGVCLSEASMTVGQEESYTIPIAFDDYMLHENMFYEFHETIMKMGNNLRLCMRESLFRLARNAMERQNPNIRYDASMSSRNDDEISTNETRGFEERSHAMPDVETVTNPIDRIVAHLLFYSPPVSLTSLDAEKKPLSPVSGNLGSKSYNTWGCITEEKVENDEVKGNAAL